MVLVKLPCEVIRRPKFVFQTIYLFLKNYIIKCIRIYNCVNKDKATILEIRPIGYQVFSVKYLNLRRFCAFLRNFVRSDLSLSSFFFKFRKVL